MPDLNKGSGIIFGLGVSEMSTEWTNAYSSVY